jgi:hypothetical protein
MFPKIPVVPDAWMSGQIGSKLWLARELEALGLTEPLNIWILGGWYAQTAFLLLARERLPVKRIRSFDLDPEVADVAEMVNETWVFRDWQFRAFTADCNSLTEDRCWDYFSEPPDLYINTSSEHFDSMAWWDNIPDGKLVAVQSNDMDHADHLFHITSQAEMRDTFPLRDLLYSGELAFDYGSWGFTRYMVIGRK